MSSDFTSCDIFNNLRQFQKISLFTDLEIFSPGGSMPAHKVMLADVFNSLGITDVDRVDGLILPDVSFEQVDLAMSSLYKDGGTERMKQICSSFSRNTHNSSTHDQSDIIDAPRQENVSQLVRYEKLVLSNIEELTKDTKEEDSRTNYPWNMKDTKYKKLYCDKCDYVTGRKDRLEKHKSSEHEGDGYSCDYCEYTSYTKMNIKNHTRQTHPKRKEMKMLMKISCDQCDFVAKTNDGRPRPDKLPVHKRIEHGQKFPCDLCGKVFLKEEKLTVHKKSQHDSRIHKCDECDYSTTIKWNLPSHYRVKHTDQMFYCDQCEFSGKLITQVNRHIQVKHEGKLYYCEECEYSAPYKGGLSRHIEMMHIGITFSCSFCDYKSSTKANLKVHTDAKHLGIRYSCDMCDYKGSQAGSLKIHKQNIHDNNL